MLTEAAINGAKDHLIGLKENVIIGKLIPAGYRRTGERRRPQGARTAGRPRGPRRRSARWPRREPSTTRSSTTATVPSSDDEAAGLARAATIADGEAGAGVNPATRPIRSGASRGPVRGGGCRRRRLNPLPGGREATPSGGRTGGVGCPARPDRCADDPRQHGRGEGFDTRTSGRCYTPPSWPREGSAVGACADTPTREAKSHHTGPAGRPRVCPGRGTGRGRPSTAIDRYEGAASTCRRSASSCATAASRRSRRSRPRRCARTGTACAAARCRSRARPQKRGRLPAGPDDDAQEAELGAAQDRPRPR